MSNEPVLLSERDGVVCLTLNEPRKLNALNRHAFEELISVLERVGSKPDIRAFILTGNGRGFCAGASLDMDAFTSDDPADRKANAQRVMDNYGTPLIEKLSSLPFPTLAAVNGPAAGGGVGIALACDLVVASPNAEFRLVFTPNLGMIPDLGTVWQFARSIGRSRTIQAAFLGEPISAHEAVETGLIWKLVPEEVLLDEAWSIARKLASGPTKAYPMVRQVIDTATEHSLRKQLELEAAIQPDLMATDDMLEGALAFRDSRDPDFKGR